MRTHQTIKRRFKALQDVLAPEGWTVYYADQIAFDSVLSFLATFLIINAAVLN
tara:strand:- start:59 stop:217 length:159 start_codon:yes stop_codon:yes gene_type:complete